MGKIYLDDGRLEMDTDATARVMDSMVQHGEQFKNALPAPGTIAAAADSIGRLHSSCAVFRANYDAAVRSIEASVVHVQPTFDTLADGGRQQIAEYVRVDQEHAESIKRSGRA